MVKRDIINEGKGAFDPSEREEINQAIDKVQAALDELRLFADARKLRITLRREEKTKKYIVSVGKL